MYNFYLSRLKQIFSRGYKLLHVFWNTLYVRLLHEYTHIVQIAYKNCFEMDDFVPIFLKINSGGGPKTPPPPPTFTNLLSEGVI